MNGDSFSDDGISMEKMSSPADYTTALMYQLGRINSIGSKHITPENAQAYTQAVYELEALLVPYEDKDFIKEKKEAFESFNASLEDERDLPRKTLYQLNMEKALLGMNRSRILLRCLMRLCARNNFFPGKKIGLKAE